MASGAIHLDPVPRIEGHMACELIASDTTPGNAASVTGVQIKGTMYRGFENILYKRPVQDALLFTQRI